MFNFLFGSSFSVLFLCNRVQFFYANKKCGELTGLNDFSYYTEDNYLIFEGNKLNLKLKLYKSCPMALEFKALKKQTKEYEDFYFFYFNFVNISKIGLKIGKVFELNKQGRYALNLLMQTELEKPLEYKDFGKVLCGFEVKKAKDFETLFNLKLISKALEVCERNYKIIPVFLNKNVNVKNKVIQYNYLLTNNVLPLRETSAAQNTFELPLNHTLFKLRKEGSNKITISSNIVSFTAFSLSKIISYKIENNILKITPNNIQIVPNLNLPSEMQFKGIMAMHEDFFAILRAIETKRLKFNDKLLNKMLLSIKWHIKNNTDRNYLAKRVISLCGYVETSRQKRGIMRLSGLINKMPKCESMLTKFFNNEDIYKVNFNEPEYLEILNIK